MARRLQRQFNRTSRPNRGWAGLAPAATTSIPAASKVLVAAFTLDNDGIDETVLRTVGLLTVASDQDTSDEQQFGALGIIVVTDVAIATGITAIPDPVSEVGDDGWLLYVPFGSMLRVQDQTGFSPDWGQRYPFDSKAKRVVHSGFSLAVVVANAGTHGIDVRVAFRLLSQVRGTR